MPSGGPQPRDVIAATAALVTFPEAPRWIPWNLAGASFLRNRVDGAKIRRPRTRRVSDYKSFSGRDLRFGLTSVMRNPGWDGRPAGQQKSPEQREQQTQRWSNQTHPRRTPRAASGLLSGLSASAPISTRERLSRSLDVQEVHIHITGIRWGLSSPFYSKAVFQGRFAVSLFGLTISKHLLPGKVKHFFAIFAGNASSPIGPPTLREVRQAFRFAAVRKHRSRFSSKRLFIQGTAK